MENQSLEKFQKVCLPKVQGAMNLDRASRGMNLDYFVCFSSAISGFGFAGSTPYGFANSVTERLCEQRRKENLPAIAIQWGLVADVGVFENLGYAEDGEAAGSLPQQISSVLDTLEEFLNQSKTVVASYVTYEGKKKQSATDVKNEGDIIQILLSLLGKSTGKSLLEPWGSTFLPD